MGVLTRSQTKENSNAMYTPVDKISDISIVNRKNIHVNTINIMEDEDMYNCAVILCTLKNNIKKENLKKSINTLANQISKALERK
jgi:hypothetical protein